MAMDFDGTLFTSAGRCCPKALEELRRIGGPNGDVVRVVATGRNLHSFLKALGEPPLAIPVDYVAVGSGALIIQWPSQVVQRNATMSQATAQWLCDRMQKHSFFLLEAAPANHVCYAHEGSDVPEDFFRRRDLYREFTHGFQPSELFAPSCSTNFSQLLCIAGIGVEKVEDLSSIADRIVAESREHHDCTELQRLRWVRATSPIDKKTTWIEFFPEDVSKMSALSFVAGLHGVSREECVAVGNDFNDLDMLAWAGQSFAVGDACEHLRKHFRTCNRTCDEGAVAEVIESAFPCAVSRLSLGAAPTT